MKKEYTTEEFVKEYNNVAIENLKKKFLEDNLDVIKYISYKNKCDLAKRIVEHTSFERDEDGKLTNNVNFNSAAKHLLVTLNIINEWTNINIDFKKGVDEYDILAKNNLINIIYKSIPQTEIDEFYFILQMTSEDLVNNTLSAQAFVSNQIRRITDLAEVISTPIIEQLTNKLDSLTTEDIEKFSKRIAKIIK